MLPLTDNGKELPTILLSRHFSSNFRINKFKVYSCVGITCRQDG